MNSMMSRWPFKRKPPPLHRALGENGEEYELAAQELATRRRVRKRDGFQRNALHVAVRIALSFCFSTFEALFLKPLFLWLV